MSQVNDDPVDATNDIDQWTDEAILRALGDWGWAPDGTEVIDTEDYRVVFLPEGYDHRANVPRVDSDRPGPMIIREINDLAAAHGYNEVLWSIYPTTAPRSDAVVDLGLSGGVDPAGWDPVRGALIMKRATSSRWIPWPFGCCERADIELQSCRSSRSRDE